jgi:hypothetical protein
VSKVHVREKRKTGRKEGEERGSKMDYATTDSKKKLHCHLPPPSSSSSQKRSVEASALVKQSNVY